MINHLQRHGAVPSDAPRKKRHKGWTPERRARQAAVIRRWQPWRHSTGPKTELGKARCAMNPTRHDVAPNDACVLAIRRARQVLRLAARNLAILGALKRAASLRPLTDQESALIPTPHSLLPTLPIRYSPFATRPVSLEQTSPPI